MILLQLPCSELLLLRSCFLLKLLSTVLLQGHTIIFNCLHKCTLPILAGSPCKRCVDMIWIKFEDSCQVLNPFIYFPQLFVGASPNIKSPSVRRVDSQKLIAVIDRIVIEALLHERGSSYKQSLFMWRIYFEFLGTNVDEIVYIDGLSDWLCCWAGYAHVLFTLRHHAFTKFIPSLNFIVPEVDQASVLTVIKCLLWKSIVNELPLILWRMDLVLLVSVFRQWWLLYFISH